MSDDFDRRLDALRYSVAEQMTRIAARLDAIEHRLFSAENTLDAWRATSDRALRGLETRLTELETRCDERIAAAVASLAMLDRRLHLVETAVTIARGPNTTGGQRVVAWPITHPVARGTVAATPGSDSEPVTITDAEPNAPR